MKTYVVIPLKNHLDEMVLMMSHKICFYGEIWLIIPKLSVTLHIWSTVTLLFEKRQRVFIRIIRAFKRINRVNRNICISSSFGQFFKDLQ